MKRIAAVSLGLVFLAGCGKEQVKAPAKVEAASVGVRAIAVAEQEWPLSFEAAGTVRARTVAAISSKVMGYVQQVPVRVGDHVRAGQVLITLEVRDLDAAVRTAEIGKTEVQSAIPEAESAIRSAQANLDLAQATFRRMNELFVKKSISNQEFDETTAKLRAAETSLEMAKARRAQLDSRLAGAEQGIRSASVMREYSKLVAPFAGLVTARSTEPGNLASPGVPLLTLEQEGSLRLEANLDESRLGLIKVGQTVEVTLESLEKKLGARVSEIEPSVDAASRAYIVKIDLPGSAQARPGMFGRAVFTTGTRKVLAVPAGALREQGQLQSVFAVEEGAVHTRLVTTGERTAAAVEVLSGLSAGEKVVSPVPAGLQDGARVEVRP